MPRRLDAVDAAARSPGCLGGNKEQRLERVVARRQRESAGPIPNKFGSHRGPRADRRFVSYYFWKWRRKGPDVSRQAAGPDVAGPVDAPSFKQFVEREQLPRVLCTRLPMGEEGRWTTPAKAKSC